VRPPTTPPITTTLPITPLPVTTPPITTTLPVKAVATTSQYTIQIAALVDAGNARAVVKDLARRGFDAYLLSPAEGSADNLYRVRVGRYASRLSAQRVATRLERILGLKLWFTRAR
jgi:cell division septation protein DedD